MTMRALVSIALAGAALAGAAPAAAQQPTTPIPGPLSGPLPRYAGAPAEARPLPGPSALQNPALAPDGTNGTGLAAGNGGGSPFAGPLGTRTTGASSLQQGTCASLAFDGKARLVAVCNGPMGPSLRLIDPVSLGTLSTMNLPARTSGDRRDVAGGTHFVVRADGTLLVPTNGGALITVTTGDGALAQTASTDLSSLLASRERPFAVAAGFDGRDWVAGTAGTVIAVPRGGGAPRKVSLGEPVAEDIATDPSGTYVVTAAALYRLQADPNGVPRVVWRQRLLTGLADANAGRFHAGSGTPPAIVAGRWVAVADGVNPPRVNVVRIAGGDDERLACAVPVFRPGYGSVEAQLVVAGRGIVVANAYGYSSIATTEGGHTSTGGLAQVVVGRRGCRTAWTNAAVVSPSAQATVSRATGLLYTLTKPGGFPDAWNLTAIDWRTGEARFSALAGEGLGYNSEGGPVVIGPDGSAYAGTFGGVVRFHDAR